MSALPKGLLVAWYGDDFTGAAAVMEVLAFAGLPTMLFLDVPTEAQLARFPGLQAIGVASTARAQSKDWMDSKLPAAFRSLLALEPQLLHYKICSTLDSSPDIGSIGRAIEIGGDLTTPQLVPFLVAAPQMRRYQFFGHLFVGLDDKVFRLDQHPVMSRHPVTPMMQSDVAQHIAAQSERLDMSLWSLEDIATDRTSMSAGSSDLLSVVTMDCIDSATEAAAGKMIWQNRASNRFVVGSQGVEFALVRHWIETGALPKTQQPGSAGVAKRLIAISGSVSPTTSDQIRWSREHGFASIRFDARQACGDANSIEREVDRVVAQCLDAISSGKDPLVFTAEGPDDPVVEAFKTAVETSGKNLSTVNKNIGIALGEVLGQSLAKSGIQRAIISGGDTSGFATQQLGFFALSALAPTIPGASLCKAHADGPLDGLELALKGGQMGTQDYFGWIRDGGGER